MRFYLPHGMLKRTDVDLSDLTTVKQTGEPRWDPEVPDVLVVPTDREPTKAERAKIKRRLTTVDPLDEDLHTQIANVRDDLAKFAALTKPTTKQTEDAVKSLCKAVGALVDLHLREPNGIDG